MTSLSHQMAQFALNLQYEDIPAEAIKEAKRFLLDSIGCALAAVKNEDMQAMYRFTEKLGGTPEATLIGTGLRTNAPNAALMNCLLTRALDYNDIYWEQDPSHPSDIIGAALAAAEANGKNGRDALVAIMIAYELEMRWCHAAEPGVREVGWHHATLTQFVSPLVAGRMYDLDIDQMVAATGISGSSHFTLGGVVAGHLTNMKNTADPLASQAGVIAAMMAREGYEGPVEVIEGKEGLIEVLNNVEWRTDWLLKGLGHEFMITQCSYKAFPTEALTHQPISAALQVCREHGIAAEDVAEILVETTTRGADILSDPSKFAPKTKETADHSLPYVIAAAVADGNVLPDSFSDEKLKDPRIWDLLSKIKVVADPEIDALFPGVKRARVSITTTGGSTHTAQVDHAKGSPQNPMSDEEIVAKFRANAEGVVSTQRQDEIIETTWKFEDVEDIGMYMRLLVSE
ncbi:MAG: MmgE/PrpD family protein [Anaerolineales bacterium]|nr:MmgE/PrpD family protein [Chloroflexota bacterium]MBL6982497.1 MmgE/PrpD family protein [Anaerolineales bacterium]